ncbi:MAG TPA: IPT/TIG domain-containing protein, partial [Gemmataceae bacterium]|nr:IPT/TIG domain-containing protein [Gemmataceae bacterium]
MSQFSRQHNDILSSRLWANRARLQLEVLEDRLVPTLLGNALFPADNPWNQNIANAPVAANSAGIMNAIIGAYGNGQLHPDFGQDTNSDNPLYGIPYNVVHGNTQPKVNVVIDDYVDESDVEPVPIPANAVIEGDMQDGPTVGLDNRGDSHLIVYDEDNNIVYELYATSRPSENADDQWHADQESVWNLNANTFRTIGYTSADAAGLPILPGLARPDEALPVSQGGQGVITHALRMTLQNSVILDQFIYPASHVANPGNDNAAIEPPMGARFRLKASVDISQLNPEAKIIAQALKDYGLIVADNGSNFYITGSSYSVDANNDEDLTWDDNDIQDTLHGLKSLTFSDFEVVDLTPIVSGLSTTNGSAGMTVTVSGQNFSGAAGHLKVLFGTTPATLVNVVDDSHVTAVVPEGSGAVDVRVLSG